MSQRVPPRPGASRLDPDAEWLAASEGAARGGARRPGGFDAAVYALVRRIPAGRVMTYGQVAARVGVARGARAVGGAMRRCPPGVPWHRVVNGSGAVSRRANPSSMLTQRLLLRREGVRFVQGHVDLDRYRWSAGPARGRVDIAALPTA